MLVGIFNYSGMDFHCEINANNLAIFLHYSFWRQRDFSDKEISESEKNKILAFIKEIWSQSFPQTPLLETYQHADQ